MYYVVCVRDGIKKNVDLPTVYILRAAARAYIDRIIYELTYNITYILHIRILNILMRYYIIKYAYLHHTSIHHIYVR